MYLEVLCGAADLFLNDRGKSSLFFLFFGVGLRHGRGAGATASARSCHHESAKKNRDKRHARAEEHTRTCNLAVRTAWPRAVLAGTVVRRHFAKSCLIQQKHQPPPWARTGRTDFRLRSAALKSRVGWEACWNGRPRTASVVVVERESEGPSSKPCTPRFTSTVPSSGTVPDKLLDEPNLSLTPPHPSKIPSLPSHQWPSSLLRRIPCGQSCC